MKAGVVEHEEAKGGTVRITRKGRFAVVTIVATALTGLASIGVAHADATFTVTPSTGLTDGQPVTIQLAGLPPSALAEVQISECGNAYADGTPLAAIVPGPTDCVVLPDAFGPVSGTSVEFDNVPLQQTGIGTENLTCITSPPAAAPCYLYVSSSINEPPLPSADIAFAQDPTTMNPASTTTSVMPIGAPLGSDKTAHALVRVTTTDPQLQPDGNVSVYEGANLLGGGTLADGSANVTLGTFSLGTHDLVAQYAGDGSFLSSTSPTTPMSIISPTNISVGDASIVEGNAGTPRTVAFPVVLSQPPSVLMTVQYAVTGSGTHPATAGVDFTSAAGTLKFPAGKITIKYVVVKILPDTVAEPDETFSVTLSNPTAGYVLRRPVGTGTIIDDDSAGPGVTINVGDSSVPEGDVGGAHAMKFPLSLSQPVLTGNVVVTVRVSSITAVHRTKGVGQWGGAILRNITFKNGKVDILAPVPAFPDTIDGLDETIRIDIVSVVATGTTVTIGRGEGIGTILSDE